MPMRVSVANNYRANQGEKSCSYLSSWENSHSILKLQLSFVVTQNLIADKFISMIIKKLSGLEPVGKAFCEYGTWYSSTLRFQE